MKIQIRNVKQTLWLLFCAIIFLSTALAQLISLKTVPVATGDQF